MFRDLAAKATHVKSQYDWEQRSVFLFFTEKNIGYCGGTFIPEWLLLSNNVNRLIGVIFSLSPEIVFLDRTVWQCRTVWQQRQLTNIRYQERDESDPKGSWIESKSHQGSFIRIWYPSGLKSLSVSTDYWVKPNFCIYWFWQTLAASGKEIEILTVEVEVGSI